MAINIVNKKVRHITKGLGIVVNQKFKYIDVVFESGDKGEYRYPEAFEKILEMVDDSTTQDEIQKVLAPIIEKRTKQEKKDAEEREAYERLLALNSKTIPCLPDKR